MLSVALVTVTAPALAASVTFTPGRVAQGGGVRVRARPSKSRRVIFLGKKHHHRKSDVPLGRIRAGRARARLTVPLSARPGKYFVIACHGRRCHTSQKRLTVIGKKVGNYRYEVVYSHSDVLDHTDTQNSAGFIGTTHYQQSLKLSSRVDLAGDPTTTNVAGSGAIDYTEASYSQVQSGSFGGQGGPAGEPGSCNGTATAALVATTPGTASVLGLKIQGQAITLDFRPGDISAPTPAPPSETVKYDDDFGGQCYEGHETHERNLFLGEFGSFYNSLNPVANVVYGSDGAYLHLDKGWKLNKGGGHVFATLVVSGQVPGFGTGGTYTDQFEIDRYPVK
ncbi:MAG: hypothetical protein R2686_08405 [Candidatus Nanopelagicales bacterium]